jgi:hypothetical protein
MVAFPQPQAALKRGPEKPKVLNQQTWLVGGWIHTYTFCKVVSSQLFKVTTLTWGFDAAECLQRWCECRALGGSEKFVQAGPQLRAGSHSQSPRLCPCLAPPNLPASARCPWVHGMERTPLCFPEKPPCPLFLEQGSSRTQASYWLAVRTSFHPVAYTS